MRKNYFTVKIMITVLGVLMAPLCFANTETENEMLARIVHELDMLTPLVEQAKAQADDTSRVRFHYEWLSEDLAAVKAGINEKLENKSIEPRVVAPLKEDYLEEPANE